jgi:hypothetical protein
MCAHIREFLYYPVINLVIDDYGLFGGANRPIIKGFGGDDIHHGHLQLRRLFQIDRGIARSHT